MSNETVTYSSTMDVLTWYVLFLLVVMMIGLVCAAFMKHAGAAYRATLMEIKERERRRRR